VLDSTRAYLPHPTPTSVYRSEGHLIGFPKHRTDMTKAPMGTRLLLVLLFTLLLQWNYSWVASQVNHFIFAFDYRLRP
jgi:hypothetical protein